MKTIKGLAKYVAARSLLLIFTITSIPTAQAQAGFLDWLSGNETNTVLFASASDIRESFDELLGGIKSPVVKNQENPLIQENAVMGVSSHITPNAGRTAVNRKMAVEVSAYSSTPDQTDDSPFITAKGTYVRDGIVAANFLPFGTRIKIPSVYGDKIFVVEDRMNKRYQRNVDIWMVDRQSAKNFGRKELLIEIVSS